MPGLRNRGTMIAVMKLAAALFLGLAAAAGTPGPSMAQAPQHTPPPTLHCPGDKVVWVNTRSGIYHFRGERCFGSTRCGKFMCAREADPRGRPPNTERAVAGRHFQARADLDAGLAEIATVL